MNRKTVPMSALTPGESAIVSELIDGGRNIADRLHDIGVREGGVVECMMRSPLGDPSAYLIMGSIIAMRRADANCVKVISIKKGENEGKNAAYTETGVEI